MTQISDTWFAIVNPHAGSGKTLPIWREAEKMLYSKRIRYHAVTPESPAHSVKLIQEACAEGYRKFMAVGGDGTVHTTMGAIVSYIDSCGTRADAPRLEEFMLAVMPIGSGNDWLRSHNIPADTASVVNLIAAGSFAKQDVVRADIIDHNCGKILHTSYMANVGGYNFDANVCEVVNGQKSGGSRGKLLYLKALLKMAVSQKAYRTQIVCDGRTVFDDLCYTISIGNGLYSGGGLCQTPSAVMDDGLLDLMIAPKFPVWKLFFNVHKLLQKRTEEIPFLHFCKGSKIEIAPVGQGQLVEIDGEIIGRAPLRIKVLDQRINVLHQKS